MSVLAARKKHFLAESECPLFAANGTPIKTYGKKTLCLNLGLRRPFKWTFILADVRNSIIGADFLSKHKLLVDLHSKRLRDEVTSLSADAQISFAAQPTIQTVDNNNKYYDILKKYSEVINPNQRVGTALHNVEHYIHTEGPPTHEKVRPLNPERYRAAKREFQSMMEEGICRPSSSPWSSPLHIVRKKNGEIRPCGDFRRLNAMTIPDRYPLPRLKDFTYIMKGKNVFTKLDIQKAYHSIRIAEQDIPKTAIITPFGLFEFMKMTFGLRNAGQTFQRFMDMVLTGLEYVFCYCDDILIASVNEEQHKKHLQEVLLRLQKYGIKLNLNKCEFGKDQMDFLGYRINTSGIRPIEDKVTVIKNYPKPETIKDLRRFLGIVNFYRSCIPRAAEYQYELNKFLHDSRKNDRRKVPWTKETGDMFEKCKESIINAVTLFHPSMTSPLALMTDCSATCAGAVLQQKCDGVYQPLGFFSKALSPAQVKYSTYDRELLAIYMAVKHFRHQIEGKELTVFTDHKPLTFAMAKASSQNDTPRRLRHLDFISQFCTDIKFIAGQENAVADALSRIEEVSFPSFIDYDELAKDQRNSEELVNLTKNKRLTFKKIVIPATGSEVLCEMSTNRIRPYVPLQHRLQAFKAVHGLSHPGARATRKMMAEKFFWPSMNKDIARWTKTCIPCQQSKVQRHTVSPLSEFPNVTRFEHVHIDIVGPLPLSEDYKYCVTMIDRKTKWPEAYPVKQITAEIICEAFINGWIARFGCPVTITTDRGRQFESELFNKLARKLGINRIHTTAYHPQANGQIERWHRCLKAALMCTCNSVHWVKELPLVMLGLRTTVKEDSGVSAAQITYGSSLRLPADFFSVNNNDSLSDYDYATRLSAVMNNITLKSHSTKTSRKCFVHKELQNTDYVFLRRDMVKRSLVAPYEGPYKVVERDKKYFVIERLGKLTTVSIDRLKPAFLLNSEKSDTADSRTSPKSADSKVVSVTRSGRVVKPVTRFENSATRSPAARTPPSLVMG